MECVLVLVVSSSLAVEDGFLFITYKSFDFSVGQMMSCVFQEEGKVEEMLQIRGQNT